MADRNVGDGFQMDGADAEAVTLVLIQAQPIGSDASSRDGGRTPFSLEFSGPATPIFPQAIYRFSHATIGEFEMFIVPLGPADGGIRYEAIFT